jgi:hypothetical protein
MENNSGNRPHAAVPMRSPPYESGVAMPTVTRYSKISLQIIVAPDFATSSTSHYDWHGGFIGDTANRPVDHHDSNG